MGVVNVSTVVVVAVPMVAVGREGEEVEVVVDVGADAHDNGEII